MNVDPIKKLQEEVETLMGKAIRESELGELFARKGLADGAIKVEYVLDLDEIQKQQTEERSINNNNTEAQELRDALQEMPGSMLMLARCCPPCFKC